MSLQLGDRLIGEAAASLKVVERSFVQDFIAVIAMGGRANHVEHFIWGLI